MTLGVASDIVLIPSQCDVLVIGAGPTGMLQALMLHGIGYDVLVVDPRLSVNQHSRAIGIHPPGLSALAQVGLADHFIENGLSVTGGWAYVDGKPVGRLTFDNNPGRWKYPIIMPQQSTEEILEGALESRKVPYYLGWKFVGFEQTDEMVHVEVVDQKSNRHTISCRILIGCDGKRSDVRSAIRSSMHGGKYQDRYLMGDFDDDGTYDGDAVINLHWDGLVESFPLPGGKRRWVARLQVGSGDENTALLNRLVQSRMSRDKKLEECSMLSSFGIERWRADRLVQGRVVIAGDAAHVVSPIGGQGMNLGWMDASDLTQCIEEVGSLSNKELLSIALSKYELSVQQRAKKGIRRAWFNTVMGRTGQPRILKLAATHLIVNTGMQNIFARRFTMLDI